jgi:malate dehydrogenase
VVWGNGSQTIYPDIRNAKIKGQPLIDRVDPEWIVNDFIPSVQSRSEQIIKWRKLSASQSTGKAAVDQMKDWVFGNDNDWQSLALYNEPGFSPYK